MVEGAAALPSGTVTFLLTDVVGSTPLWERDAELMAASLAIHRRILGEACGQRTARRSSPDDDPVEGGHGAWD